MIRYRYILHDMLINFNVNKIKKFISFNQLKTDAILLSNKLIQLMHIAPVSFYGIYANLPLFTSRNLMGILLSKIYEVKGYGLELGNYLKHCSNTHQYNP
jgi:hypothetical protein